MTALSTEGFENAIWTQDSPLSSIESSNNNNKDNNDNKDNNNKDNNNDNKNKNNKNHEKNNKPQQQTTTTDNNEKNNVQINESVLAENPDDKSNDPKKEIILAADPLALPPERNFLSNVDFLTVSHNMDAAEVLQEFVCGLEAEHNYTIVNREALRPT